MRVEEKLSNYNWDVESKKSEQEFQKRLKKHDALRAIQRPVIHFVYTLNFQEGSFFNLSELKGLFNFVRLHYSIFYRPTAHLSLNLKSMDRPDNSEKFLLPEILNERLHQIVRRYEFEGLKFDVWTNGLEFEIVLEKNTLEEKSIDYTQLPVIFGRWTARILLDSLDLISELDPRLEKLVSDNYLQGTIYDYIVDLNFSSFIIITYPNIQAAKDDSEKSETKKIHRGSQSIEEGD